ncbi:serine/threonine protein kinase [Halobacillus litoralis]|uniref:serine/threonine protein kinase n=1 Tax=Halobacillus litoralis TaxID=45668 RepID=UPI001CD1DFA1|nr:serine/threonine protein kinase [Halobacillus litoralis]MCA0969333.1 serine/threonine protein kinase [Halobacillus litoralis]
MHTYTIDHVTFRLREPHDFKWLEALGTVFAVFDEQDSGNICFGVENEQGRQFIKYAGASPEDFDGKPADAVTRLKKAVPLYKELAHEHLIQYKQDFSTEEGYATVFDWFNGECMHAHWSYPPPAKYKDPNSPYYKYRHLPLDLRLQSFDALLDFHEFMESQGYVAVDLYDGSILYDFDTDTTKLCDIDFYEKGALINEVGEAFWGSTRSKAPEEYEKGAVIDNVSNVYTLGALAFSIFGSDGEFSKTRWDAGDALYSIASRAVENERAERFSSIRDLHEAWQSAKRKVVL